MSYDDPLDYKLTSNDIRSNAVFLKKIDVLFQIKSKQLFFDLLNAMIQLAEKTTTYVIKKRVGRTTEAMLLVMELSVKQILPILV